MPVSGRRFDFQLGGKGFMLSRAPGTRGRAWQRKSTPDTPVRLLLRRWRDPEDTKYGGLDPQLDYPEVWDDWSGGGFHPYRKRHQTNVYHWAENFDARFPRQLVHCQQAQLMPAHIGAITYSAEVACDRLTDWAGANVGGLTGKGAVGVISNQIVAAYSPTEFTASPLMLVHYLASNAAPFGGRPATWGSYNYVADLAGTYVWYTSLQSGEALGTSSIEAQNLLVAGGRLWRSHGVHGQAGYGYYLQSCAEVGLGAVFSQSNWGATYALGNRLSGIKDMVSLDDQVFCGLDEGLFAGDMSGTFVNVLSGLSTYIHADNCRDLAVHGNAVVAPHVTGLYEFMSGRIGEVRDISPAGYGSDRSPLRGYVRAVTSHGPWLVAGQYNGSASYLMAGREDGNEWVWHPLNRLPGVTKVSRLHIDGITVASSGAKIPNRLWIATDASVDTGGTCPVYYYPIPPLFGNPLVTTSPFVPNYVGSARMDLGRVDWDAPGTAKVYRSVEVWAENLASAAQWCDVYYTVDGGTRTLLGTVAKSPKDTLFFSSGEGSFVTGQSIELSIQSFTASAQVSPVYRALVLRGALQPRSIEEITAVVRIADGILDRQGGPMRRGATMLQELRDFGNPDRQGLQGHQLVDLAGAAWQVKVLGGVEEQEVYMGQGDEVPPEIAATLRMAVLTFTGA